MTIEVRSLRIGNGVPADIYPVYIPYGLRWYAWCGISYIYPTAGFTNSSYVVADIYRMKEHSDTVVPGLWDQIRSPFDWGGLFGEKGNILNPRKPHAFGKTDQIGYFGTLLGTTLYFRLYRTVAGVKAGGFGVIHSEAL